MMRFSTTSAQLTVTVVDIDDLTGAVCSSMKRMGASTKNRLSLILAAAILATVAVDRFDYSAAIADSWKQQTLLNIVKFRYVDLPVFVDVSSIIAGYSLQTGVSVNGVLSSERAVQGDYGSLGGQAIYTDRPTITYVPMTGESSCVDSSRRSIRRIFSSCCSLGIRRISSWPSVEALNGVRNRTAAGRRVREADPDFVRALQLLREVQLAGGVGMRVEEDQAKRSTAVLYFQHDDMSAETREKAAEVRRLLRLPEGQQKFVLSYSPMRGERARREKSVPFAGTAGIRELR
jgi:hypothetical protein